MKTPQKTNEKGFTIIEVMIVLAIAALILVVVLVAIPQLQRNQRNNARQNTTSRVLTEMNNYAGNNNGRYPTNIEDFESRYMSGLTYEEPTQGTNYTITEGGDPTIAAGVMGYFPSSRCDGEDVVAAEGNRQIALQVELEPGNIFYCVDNS